MTTPFNLPPRTKVMLSSFPSRNLVESRVDSFILVLFKSLLELKLSPILQPKSLRPITRVPIPYCVDVGVAGVDKDVRMDVQVATSWSLSTWVLRLGKGQK